MAGHITLTKTKDGYVTYDELLAELRKNVWSKKINNGDKNRQES